MAGPVYVYWECRWTEAWYRLSKAEQDQLMAKIDEALKTVGGRYVLVCSSAWASEQTQFWGVNEFPDIEAVQKQSQLHRELDWYRYVDSRTLLGVKSQP